MDFEHAHASRPNARAGASGGGAVADDEEALPQTVWLRGDEPYCAEFLLDAEAVMQQLQIRRSRLTQISGKELRVGRMRKGRYVSPVYRQADVDAYLSLTRATASHLKSSSVLSDAAAKLSAQGEALGERLAHVPDELAAQLEERWAAALTRTAAVLHERLDQLTGGVVRADGAAERLAFGLTTLQRGADSAGTRLSQLLEASATQALVLERLLLEVRETAAAMRLSREAAEAQALRHSDEQGAVRHALTHLAAEVAIQAASLEGLAAAQHAAMTDLSADLRRALATQLAGLASRLLPPPAAEAAGTPVRSVPLPRQERRLAAVRRRLTPRP